MSKWQWSGGRTDGDVGRARRGGRWPGRRRRRHRQHHPDRPGSRRGLAVPRRREPRVPARLRGGQRRRWRARPALRLDGAAPPQRRARRRAGRGPPDDRRGSRLRAGELQRPGNRRHRRPRPHRARAGAVPAHRAGVVGGRAVPVHVVPALRGRVGGDVPLPGRGPRAAARWRSPTTRTPTAPASAIGSRRTPPASATRSPARSRSPRASRAIWPRRWRRSPPPIPTRS